MKDKSVQGNVLYRQLSSDEKSTLIKNCNQTQNWDSICVSNDFDPDFIHNCHFFGEIRIGAIKNGFLERFGFSAPAGLYNSTFIDCTIGDFVSINDLHYCANYTIGNNVIIHNIGELISSDSATFGNGISGTGNKSFIDLVNEIGGRAIIPFDGIICTDAFLWAKYRENSKLLQRLEEITAATCSKYKTGAFIGNESVLRNVKSIRDCKIGENVLVDCAEIMLNTTIHSDNTERTSIGAGVQLRNAIIGFGNSIDSGTQLNTVITGCNVSIS
ncbi:MAG: DUF4954 family protein, partial [Fibrobacter sp.]|nr:DUF4954 family protein [Fibrobacter sp.]